VNALDVVGQNEYVGWYEMRLKMPTMFTGCFRRNRSSSPVRGGSQAGQPWRQRPALGRGATGNVYEHQFVMINKIPQVRGLVPWILMDFVLPAQHSKLQDGFNRKGLIAEDGQKKQAFYLFQKTYKERSVGKGRVARFCGQQTGTGTLGKQRRLRIEREFALTAICDNLLVGPSLL